MEILVFIGLNNLHEPKVFFFFFFLRRTRVRTLLQTSDDLVYHIFVISLPVRMKQLIFSTFFLQLIQSLMILLVQEFNVKLRICLLFSLFKEQGAAFWIQRAHSS